MKATYVLVFAVAAALAGCNNSSNPVQSGCIVQVLPPVPTIFAMLYPLPGATAVPANVGQVILQLSNPAAQIGLSAGSAPAVSLGTPAPAVSPLPSPMATGLGPNAPLYAVRVPTLAAGTVYSVVQTQTFGNPPCVNTSSATIGTFTTQ